MANPKTVPQKTPRLFPPHVLLASTVAKDVANKVFAGASSIYRMALPASALRQAGLATTVINYGLPTIKGAEAAKSDTVVMNNHYTDQLADAIKIYKKSKSFLAYDFDDLYWNMDAANPNSSQFPSDMLQRLRKACAQVDIAIVSTPRLAEQVKKSLSFSDDRIKIVRNTIPNLFITTALAAKKKGVQHAKPRVGWAGGISHAGDLALLKDVVERTADRIQWVFMGMAPECSPSLYEFHNPVPFGEYPAKLASLDLDLALAPLADTEFNACKSDLRVLEYAACGFPVLASNSPAFEEVPEFLFRVVNNSADVWVQAITNLVLSGNNENLDIQAQQLHDWLKSNRLLESPDNLKRWAWAWTPDDQIPFEPGSAAFDETTPVIVGEPITSLPNPPFRTIAEAHAAFPCSPLICIRPGCVPSDEQLAELIHASGDNLSTCVLSNDADYPAPGQFAQLTGKTMRDMAEAALSCGEVEPIHVPYSTGPVTYLSAKALSVVGVPDEARYEGDIEIAIIDWCARLRDMGLNYHAALPNLFVPVFAPGRVSADQDFAKNAIMEIAAWHPSFKSCEQESKASNPHFAKARKNIDRGYARISYEAPICSTYTEWSALHDTLGNSGNEWAENLYKSESLPTISIVMPVYNTDADTLRAAINSVKAQTYKFWQLVIVDDNSNQDGPETVYAELYAENDPRIQIFRRSETGHISAASNTGLEHCTGDWVFFLDHDDTLAPYALTAFVYEIISSPDANLVYGDSDMISPDGQVHSPDFKPGFDYDLFLGQNYIRGCYKLNTIREIGGFRSTYDGSQDYDLTLRYIEAACWKAGFGVDTSKIAHVPLVVYHWRQSPDSVSSSIDNKPYAIEAARKAVLEHLKRTGRNAFIGPHPAVQLHNLVRFLPDNPAPKASIIILCQLDRRRLDNCVKSILEKTAYPNYEIVIRQVGDDPGISDAIRLLCKKDSRIKHTKGGGHAGTFNFALLNNVVVEKHIASDSEVLVFLNDDTQIAESAWLADMVGTAMRPDVGAVGVKLMYPNGQVQHNGVILDHDAPSGEYALHLHRGMRHEDPSQFGRAALTHQCAAVTAACMAVRREVFLSVKGFDAVKFPIDYNDVDLCLRLSDAGYVNVVLSHVLVVHLEGGTKRSNPYQISRSGMLEAEMTLRVLHADADDPYHNPNHEHHPGNSIVKTAPPRPWRVNIPARVLLIGSEKEDGHALYIGGELPIRMEASGPWLKIVEPVAEHGGVVDTRNKLALAELIGDLDIQRVILRKVGGGTAESLLGTLVDAGNAGMPINYTPSSFEAVCPRLDCTNSEGACGHKWQQPTPDACQLCIDRDGSPYGSVSYTGWRLMWGRFSEMLAKQKIAAIADPDEELIVGEGD